jgi:Ca2+-binding RTX toxin-like protein
VPLTRAPGARRGQVRQSGSTLIYELGSAHNNAAVAQDAAQASVSFMNSQERGTVSAPNCGAPGSFDENEWVHCSDAGITKIQVFLGQGDDILEVKSVDISMDIRGGLGDDRLEGGSGDDTVVGGPGNENEVDGKEGEDTFSYDDGRANGVKVNLTSSTSPRSDGGVDDNIDAGRESLLGFENVIGSDAADQLIGDPGSNEIDGQGGADTIDAGAGNDIIKGGAGDDTLDGEADADVMDGEADFDTVDYSSRTLPLDVTVDGTGGDESDRPAGTHSMPPGDNIKASVEAVRGGAGDDQMTVDGVTGPVRLEGNGGRDRLTGGPGNDTLLGGDEADHLTGGPGDDGLRGEAGGDTLEGGADRDTVNYGDRTEPVTASIGAGTGDDGGATDGAEGSRDTIASGVEEVIGGTAADTLIGDADANDLDGRGGDDTIRGGLGTDVLNGGANRDTLDYSERTAAQPVDVSLDGVVNDGGAGENDEIFAFEAVTGGAGDDNLSATQVAGAKLRGEGGDDKLFAPASGGTLAGGDGAGVLTGDAAADTLDGGEGDYRPGRQGRRGHRPRRCGRGPDRGARRRGRHRGLRRGGRHRAARHRGRGDRLRAAAGSAGRPGPPVAPPADPAPPVVITLPPAPAASQLIPATVAFELRAGKSFTTLKRLRVRNLVTDSTVTVTCKSRSQKGCPRKSVTKRGSFAVVLKEFVGKRLPVGTTLTIRVTAPGWVGVIKTMTVRKSRSPLMRTQCLPPGAAKPGAC